MFGVIVKIWVILEGAGLKWLGERAAPPIISEIIDNVKVVKYNIIAKLDLEDSSRTLVLSYLLEKVGYG